MTPMSHYTTIYVGRPMRLSRKTNLPYILSSYQTHLQVFHWVQGFYVFIMILSYWWIDATTPSLLLVIGRLALVMDRNKNISFSLSLSILFHH